MLIQTAQIPTLSELLITKTILLNGDNKTAKRQEILEYFHNTFSLYESLFDCLNGEDAYYIRANQLRHPLIFYYGHTAVFFINKLKVAGLIQERIDPVLESMLAVGVDEMSWDDLDESNYNWPSPAKVKAYRDQARQVIDCFIHETSFELPINWENPFWIIMMGIEHERIHLETSSVLIRELPLEYVKSHVLWDNICPTASMTAPINKLLPVSGGLISLGKRKDNPIYGWDNEYGKHTEKIAHFKASQYLVSNKEFLAFVEADGYHIRRYWCEEGWGWVQFRHAERPVYWAKNDTKYMYRTMLQCIDMPWNWPVEVNCLEAKAFCRWKSEQTGKIIRLPTEAEWYKLRELVSVDQPDWQQAPGNINLEGTMSPCPVDCHEFHDGFFDIIGNVWQWTETPIDGYKGFSVHPVYDDFSTPTFDGKHNLIKGGCWISTGNYAIKDSRYAFRRHFYQHAGFRYIEGSPLPEQIINKYEDDQIVSQYIEFHYGDVYFGVPNFPLTCAQLCIELMSGRNTEKALDIGCASGRASFELAKTFQHVDAIDFSARLIQAPVNLQKNGMQRYTIQDEGELVTYKEISLEKFGYESIKSKVNFMQGDACNLSDKFRGYDLVFAGNLIDRLYDPAKFLKLIMHRLRLGGLLVLTSPYTWLEEYTERNNWLGGFKAETGESFTTLEGISNIMHPTFELVGETRDIPFVIRETRRKFQHTLAEISVWEKRY
ncbi:MAG: 5-histidylcysteine sulfoxide synthase [Symploca sp. SIO2E6]|nr:5-histidylcysteine sulfoxide synthase [Symploca sp. SIO2E6]